MTRSYEALYIVHPELQDEEVTTITEKYKEVVEGQGGEVDSVNRWEKRRLAYQVKGQREGIYILMTFKGEQSPVVELDRVFKISEDVMRHLIVRTDDE